MVVGGVVLDDAKKEAFRGTLLLSTPHGRGAAWADVVWQVAQEQGVNPFLLSAIMERESGSGELLSPPGPAGTGDGGHGRGLMQLDDRVTSGRHAQVVADGTWADPYTNLTVAVTEHIQPDLTYFSKQGNGGADPRPLAGDALLTAATASYNAGSGAVLKALENGETPDSVTTGRDYATSVLSLYATLWQKFATSVPGVVA